MEEIEEEFGTEVGLKKATLETSQNSGPSAGTREVSHPTLENGCVAQLEKLWLAGSSVISVL